MSPSAAPQSPTVLLVEDDRIQAEIFRDALAQEGYTVVHAVNAQEGWRYFQSLHPALVITDVGLPDELGTQLCERIRAHGAFGTTPVIMLTARGSMEAKEVGFSAGADHYLVKPIQIAELKLWVKALLRRVGKEHADGGLLRAEDFVIDPKSHRVTVGGAVIPNLTVKEFDLLYELVRRRPHVVSKEQLLRSVWHDALRDNTVEVHIKNVRSKLGDAARRIVTVHGLGYRFE